MRVLTLVVPLTPSFPQLRFLSPRKWKQPHTTIKPIANRYKSRYKDPVGDLG